MIHDYRCSQCDRQKPVDYKQATLWLYCGTCHRMTAWKLEEPS